jgi:hypothetical protein
MERFMKNAHMQRSSVAAVIASDAMAVWDAVAASTSADPNQPARSIYVRSVLATANTLRPGLPPLPPIAAAELALLKPAVDSFFATVSLVSKGPPLAPRTVPPDLAVKRALAKHNLRHEHETALGLAASSNAPLYEKGWTNFAALTLVDANSILAQLDLSLRPFALASFDDLLAGLRLERPGELSRSYDELVLAFERSNLPRPAVVLVPPFPAGSPCDVCGNGARKPSKNPPSKPTLITSKGVFPKGALCFSLVCALCASSSFVSSVHERRAGVGTSPPSLSSAYGFHALSDDFIRVSQRLVVERSYLEHMDEVSVRSHLIASPRSRQYTLPTLTATPPSPPRRPPALNIVDLLPSLVVRGSRECAHKRRAVPRLAQKGGAE